MKIENLLIENCLIFLRLIFLNLFEICILLFEIYLKFVF